VYELKVGEVGELFLPGEGPVLWNDECVCMERKVDSTTSEIRSLSYSDIYWRLGHYSISNGVWINIFLLFFLFIGGIYI